MSARTSIASNPSERWRAAAALADRWADRAVSRAGAAVLGALAVGVYWLQAIAWPVQPGRDALTYLLFYADVAKNPPVLPQNATAIQPIASVTMGFLLDHIGGTGIEIVLGLMFAASVVAFACVGAVFGKWVAVAIAVVLLVYPPYASLFHEVASDQMFALGIAFWSLAIVYTLRAPSWSRLVLTGLALAVLVETRGGGMAFAIVGLAPLLLAVRWRLRLAYTAVFVASCIAALGVATLYNGLRYDDYTVSRPVSAGALFGVFSDERLVQPSNGPASRALARAVQMDLLKRQPYRAYGITLQSFFEYPSDRYWSDLVSLSDRYWGWNSNYSKLRQVAIEAVLAHKSQYVHDVAHKIVAQFSTPYYRAATVRQVSAASLPPRKSEYIRVNGRELPKPSEGQPIPAANLDWELSTPHQTIWTDWSSIAHPTTRFADPRVAREFAQIHARALELEAKLATRDGSRTGADILNGIAHRFPALWLWLVAGTVGIAVRRPRHWPAAVALLGVGVSEVLVASLTQPLVFPYRIPFDPLFLLFGLVGLLGVVRLPRPGAEQA